MGRTNYDDWNVFGQSSEDEVAVSGSIPFHSNVNSAVILISSALLIIAGIVAVYSATYPKALGLGFANYYYLTRHLVYIGAGIVISLIFVLMPEKILRILCPISMLICLVFFCINVFVENQYLLSETAIELVLVINVLYLSLFFANRENGINRLREIIIPIIFSMLFLVAILLQKNFTTGIIFIFLMIVLFAAGGVGTGGVILLVFYAAVPIICWSLSDADNIRKLLNVFVPGYYSDSASRITTLARSAISSGNLIGKGLGNGSFKLGILQNIEGEYILCNIAEEFGFVGVSVLFLIFIVFTWASFRSSRHLRYNNRFYSNFSVGLTTIISFKFIFNVVSVLGILPTGGFSLPFISYGENIVLSIVECGLIYKMSKSNESSRGFTENNVASSNMDFEVQYENEIR